MYGLSDSDLLVLRRVIEKVNKQLPAAPNRPDHPLPLAPTPDIYVVQPPVGGIPWIAGLSPGSATCDVYQMVNGTLVQAYPSPLVYNISGAVIPHGTTCIAVRDKYGAWYAIYATDGSGQPVWSTTVDGILTTTVQEGAGVKTIVGGWTAKIPNGTFQGSFFASGFYGINGYGLNVVDTSYGREPSSGTTQGADWIGITSNAILLVNGTFATASAIYTSPPFLSPYGSDYGYGLTFSVSNPIFSETVSGTGNMQMSLDPTLATLIVFPSSQDVIIPPAFGVWNGDGGLHRGDYFTDSIGNVFAGGIHVGNTTMDPTTPPTVVLNTNLAKRAINAPTLTVYGSGISTTYTDDSITFSTLGATATVDNTPPTAYMMIVTFGTPPSTTGYLLAKITVSGTDSATGIPVAIIVDAPTISIKSTAIGPGIQTLTIYGTGFDPDPAGNIVTFTTLGPPTGTCVSVSSDGTSMQVLLTSAPSGVGGLSAKVNSFGGDSNTAKVAEVTGVTPGPSVSFNATSIPVSTTTGFVIYGNYFDATFANNTVALSPSGTATVTAATATSLTMTLAGITAGPVYAIVTTNSITSGSPVQVATIADGPTITANTAKLAKNATILNITGTGFSPVASENTIALSPTGTALVQSSTATTLRVYLTSSIAVGSLTAIVTVNGQASSSVQVATGVDLTVDLNMSNISASAPYLEITGTEFAPFGGTILGASVELSDGQLANATWVSYDGTSLIFTFDPSSLPLPLGVLTAIVRSYGGTSGAATQVATVI
jgi:hypothetical protein